MANFLSFPARERGHASNGWLNTYHTFSFADYFRKDRMGFGALRVLNDDTIQPSNGFASHSHFNMEIITIPLLGSIEHRDSMGHTQVISANEVQVMSAGTGIYHSEYNASSSDIVSMLQIWIYPRAVNLIPRYGIGKFDPLLRKNIPQLIVGPDKTAMNTWINQDAWLYLMDMSAASSFVFRLNKPQRNGVFIFLISGAIIVENQKLEKRDAVGVSNADSVTLSATKDAQVLIVEVPMEGARLS